jgi:hypothetical protein
MMTTDTEIVDWLEKNANRILVTQVKLGKFRFSWGTRDEGGAYHFRPERYDSLREMVTAAIGEEAKK